ncbi:ribosomal protein S6 kinase delta-1 [Lutzomyia longipalpis]|uniref:ribosomal protein S6 kinase delta-1 n=1 Tax=Lutzomyia longipalpis TaxID=7200 RepID=UPI0024840562|nr:ribosomal protein S6 kinase delta-1 [Lutzomyia longipalpis]
MTMAAGEEGWVHSFSINDVSRHKKGYTIYKITSIIFPRYVPEALSCVTVWKRFSEIKTLYREIHRKHRALKLSGKLPKLEDSYFFRRFDTEVISERRQYILDLLEFISIHPALYTSEVFVKFLRGGHTPNVSPNHKRGGNIAEICKDLSIPFQSEIALIDPTRDSEAESDILPFDCVDSISTVSVDTLGNGGSDLSRRDSVVSDEGSIGSLAREPSVASNHQLSLQLSISQDIDYFFDAAVEFSRAMQAEVNGKYQESFESYKKGIDTLLVGAKQDNDVERQQMAKEKATKYLKRAESICENHIVKKPHPFSPTETQPYSLERPLAHLSRYKVIQIVETVMQVQDTTDKKIYIMKAIEKPPSSYLFLGAFLPHKIPYMVPLVAYFQSESSIYLLLHQAPGGKLYDYIRNFTPGEYQDVPEIPTKEELDEKPKEESSGEEAIKNAPETIEDTETEESTSEEGATYRPPSFEILSKDMDVLDLVHCAKSLLKSVSSTLRQSKGIGNEVDDIALPPVLQNIPEELENLPEDEENLLREIEKLPDVEKNSPEAAENSIKGTENQNNETENQNKETENPPRETKDLNLNEFNDSSPQTDKDPRNDPLKEFAERPKTPKKHPIPEGCVRQWARELVIAVDALHRHNVICCDLHPDNLLLGSGGQLLLTYFYCRPNATERFLRQDAMDGGYVAPERPLTEVSDWWTVGVILYEILTQTTFTVLHPGEMFNYYEVQYPEVEISDEARALIDGLLQVNPSERFGIDEILTHAFFRNTDWEAVRSMGNHS